MSESKSRFATSEKDLNLLVDVKDSKSTKRATKSVFRQYLKEKPFPLNTDEKRTLWKANEPQTKDTLAKVLELFYVEADGTSN